MKYIKRVCENDLKDKLEASGGVLIEGPKACGKTATAKQFAKSVIEIDQDEKVEELISLDPKRLLRGDTPRLIDEWQEQPKLWNHIRHETDSRGLTGQFILTGSSTPKDEIKMHSGAGRFTVVKMRPMSLFEQSVSSGEISLKDLFLESAALDSSSDATLEDIATWVTKGGWPQLINLSVSQASLVNDAYIDFLAEVDMSKVSQMKRDPRKVRALLHSYARNSATMADIQTLTDDATQESASFSRPTTYEYLDALQRLMIVEDVLAFNTHIRSSASLRKAPKRHFVDPSLAVSALGLDVERLIDTTQFLGYLFESLVIRDLRVYASSFGGQIFHYHDSHEDEVDAIIQKRNGDFAAFEIKLNPTRTNEAAKSLTVFKNKLESNCANSLKSLNIITGNGEAYTRADGINVIPIGCLGV